MPATPSLTSGRRSIKDPIIENLNVLVNGSPLRYHFIDDSLKIPGALNKHELEGEGVNLGFTARSAGAAEGGMNLQLDLPTDAVPLTGHILRKTVGSVIRYFGVTDGSEPMSRNAPVRVAPTLLEIINPFFRGLLDADLGDSKQSTYSKATMGTTETIDTQPTNTRSAATKAYSATQADGSALPTGVAIDSGTGIITITKATVAESSWEIVVVCTDTLSTLPSGHPYRVLGCEQRLYLTVTA